MPNGGLGAVAEAGGSGGGEAVAGAVELDAGAWSSVRRGLVAEDGMVSGPQSARVPHSASASRSSKLWRAIGGSRRPRCAEVAVASLRCPSAYSK